MKRLFLLTLVLLSLGAYAQDRVVGGDLSLVPAYEEAGDQWKDVNGKVIPDLIEYVHDSCGWNAVRVRLFVDPSQDDSPATCQDLDYVKALGKRVKDAGMQLLIDLHYSDTWADPGTQRIPASWTDHTLSGLCKSLYNYTYTAMQELIAAGAQPDYVQLGNEIVYGLLWNTSDGKYPSSTVLYAAAGYCNTWSNTYSANSAFPRTATLLSNGAQAVHKAFADMGIDSTAVQLVIHTASTTNMAYNSDHFYTYLKKAGFTNYDIIGLSYYPFEDGWFSTFETNLQKIATDFPDKKVQVVETAWYNMTGGTKTYDFTEQYPYSALGQYNYLIDLMTMLSKHSNVNGLYYWMPEECGSGTNKSVFPNAFNRGLWRKGVTAKHAMQLTPKGNSGAEVLGHFVDGNIPEKETTGSDAIENITADNSTESASNVYNLAGQCISSNQQGVVIKNGKKILR